MRLIIQILRKAEWKVTKTPIHEAKDWYELKPCSVKEGSLARELKGLKLVLDKVKNEDVPVIFTIFSPLTTANKLSGNTLLQYLENGDGDAVHHALKVITETTCNMARAALEAGADGSSPRRVLFRSDRKSVV